MSKIWLRIIAVLEMIGGVFGIISIVWKLATLPFNPLILLFGLIPIAIFILSFVAGLMLWKGQPFGRVGSIIIQVIQLVKIFSPALIFMFSFGFDFWLQFLIFSNGYTNYGLQFRFLTDSQLFVYNSSEVPMGFGISVPAIIFLGMLFGYDTSKTAPETGTLPPPPSEYFEPNGNEPPPDNDSEKASADDNPAN